MSASSFGSLVGEPSPYSSPPATSKSVFVDADEEPHMDYFVDDDDTEASDDAWLVKRNQKFIKGERRISIALSVATFVFFVCLLVSIIIGRGFGFYFALNIIYFIYFSAGFAMIWAVPIFKLLKKSEESVRPWQLPFFEAYALLSVIMILLAEAAILSFAIYMPEYVHIQCTTISGCTEDYEKPITALGITGASLSLVILPLFCAWPLRLLCKWVSIIRKRYNLPATIMTKYVRFMYRILPRYLDMLKWTLKKCTNLQEYSSAICKLICVIVSIWIVLMFFSCLIISGVRVGLPVGLVLFCDIYAYICYIMLIAIGEGLKSAAPPIINATSVASSVLL